MSTASPPFPAVDLTNCDREPIHILGRIQSFGYLLSVSSDWIVNHASLNWQELIGRPIEDMIGTRADLWLGPEATGALRARLQLLGAVDAVERVFHYDLLGSGVLYDVALHRSGSSIVIEVEPSAHIEERGALNVVRGMIDRLRPSETVEQLCENAARQVRALTGFDRVMIYRFGPDSAGQVIAESLAGTTDSFDGLHFPASDIPAQARALYMRNMLRIISDVNDPTVPIHPAVNPDGQPLDLSMSTLRAVSPIHVEYLRNMGVQGSMSISVLRRDAFWGLIACHHHAPLHLPYSVRTAAELFGEMFSFLLDRVETDATMKLQSDASRLHDQLMARLAGGGTILANFDDFADSITALIPCDGVAGWLDGEWVSRGATPTRAEFMPLVRFLNTTGASRVWATDHLIAAYPAGAEFLDRCAGLLALPVSRMPRDYIVLFRREVAQSVTWAGNPEKAVEFGPNGSRLTPRKSFEAWQQEVSGKSLPWSADHRKSAETLRITLIEVVLRLTDSVIREREQAAQRQDLLIAELNHRVRNILNLIRSLISQSQADAGTIEDFAEIVGSRVFALARAHDLITRTNWAPASINELIQTEGAAYVNDKLGRLDLRGTDAMVQPGAFSTMALVIHELMTNSCKYGALSVTSGQVTVTSQRQADKSLVLTWSESGGPRVAIPTRRGFGSTIIERTIPHEFGGEAELDYAPGGLQARFMLPAAQIAYFTDSSTEPVPPAAPPVFERPRDKPLSGQVLIVEDNMLIALEAEDLLESLGAAESHMAGTVAQALEIIGLNDITFALLDVNLGRETSEEVARVLQDLGTPFVFATGYGEMSPVSQTFPGAAVITKPFTKGDLVGALAKLGLG